MLAMLARFARFISAMLRKNLPFCLVLSSNTPPAEGCGLREGGVECVWGGRGRGRERERGRGQRTMQRTKLFNEKGCVMSQRANRYNSIDIGKRSSRTGL